MRLSQKLEVRKQFEEWKEKGSYYEPQETEVKMNTPHLVFNPEMVRPENYVKNISALDYSKTIANGQPQKRVKKARATSANPARIRDRAAHQLLAVSSGN